MNIKEQSLALALQAAACFELPRAFNENGVEFWLKAIALVKKRNGTQSYCLVEHRYDGMVEYKQDFGLVSPICGLVSIHPYIMLDKNKYGMKPTNRFVITGILLEFYEIKDVTFFNDTEEDELEQWKLRFAIDNQLRDTALMSEKNIYEDDGTDEDGLVSVTSSGDYDASRGIVKEQEIKENEVISQTGEVEEFTDVITSKQSEQRKKGRPKKYINK